MKTDKKFYLEDFDFKLPEELIAQYPANNRAESRLLLLNKTDGTLKHSVFNEIPSLIRAGDLLVFNDVRVMKSRIFCRRRSGASFQIVLLGKENDRLWSAVCSITSRLRENEIFYPVNSGKVSFKYIGRDNDCIAVEPSVPLTPSLLDEIGSLPLPPYIRREPEESDYERYQTVYADEHPAAAAPTAGLHFTPEILNKLRSRGADTVFVSLLVSWATFSPVRERDISLHKMHCEDYIVPARTASALNAAKKEGRRIIAVGTTALRTLESVYDGSLYVHGSGSTGIFIYPPADIKSVDALITNFHTPCSTLLMLVCAFAGYDCVMKAYREAVNLGYRFFSYGDAMFIE